MNKKIIEKLFKEYLMEEVDKLKIPKDFNSWIDKNVFANFNRMFVKNIGQKKYLGSCQHCKEDNIVLQNIKAGDVIKCPICKTKVLVRNIKYSMFSDKEFVYLVQKCSIGIVARLFMAIRTSNGLSYKIELYEEERHFLIQNEKLLKKNIFTKVFHKNSYGDWLNNRYTNMWYEFPLYNWTYPNNLHKIEYGEFKYSSAKTYCKLMKDTSFILNYLIAFRKYPCLEYFVKIGMSNMVIAILDSYGKYSTEFNLESNNLKQILGLKYKSSLDYAIRHNLTSEEILALRVLENFNIPYTKDNIEVAVEIREWPEEIYKAFGFYGFKEYVMPKLKLNSWFMSDYKDYYENCLLLKRDMSDTKWLKPYDFKIAHDQASNLVKSMQTKILDAKTRRVLKQYKMLEYVQGDYCIIVPKSARDIRLEGECMNNCVGGYVDRVAKGNSIICFIRHTLTPHKSFYTLELNPKTLQIEQCRGYHNEITDEEKAVQSFAKMWRKNIVLEKLKKVV